MLKLIDKYLLSRCPLLCRPPPPVGWGSTYCFTAVGVGVLVGVTPITNSVVGASLKKSCTPNEIYTFGIMHNSFL